MKLRPKNVSPFEWRKLVKLKTSKEFKREASEIVKSDTPSSACFEGQDSLSQLLGPDNPGRMRAMGRNMNKTKLACFQMKNKCMAETEAKQAHLQLKSVNKRSQPKCILIDWTGNGDATVVEGRIITSDPDDLVNDCRLGPSDVKVLVDTAMVPDTYLWRPVLNICTIESVIDDVDVAERRWQTQDRDTLVNGIPLRPNAVKIFVDVVHQPDTFIWTPTIDVTYLEDCLLSFVSWPVNKVVFENTKDATEGKSTASAQKSLETSQKSAVVSQKSSGPKSPVKKSQRSMLISPPQRSPVSLL
ncbi:Hypothetical protein [Arabidopsis thaliana]|uniref:F5A13.1 protein n=1 Tax=Arabidopsis thaliana TaxID=3702 RepID=Q9FZH3_ARATH|nr:Hypothetical protein [Arabidopsis thaliana]